MNSVDEPSAARSWAVLVASRHADLLARMPSSAERLQEIQQLLARASALTQPATTCALVARMYLSEWRALAGDLPDHNIFVQQDAMRRLDGVTDVLRAIRARDALASIVLIPADHCAAVESAWVRTALTTLRLARAKPNTVYLLHDQAKQEAHRPFDAALDFCSSTVIVGSAESLIDLCEGNKATQVLDMMTDDTPSPGSSESHEEDPMSDGPINLVHLRLVEEYERIQNGCYHLEKSRRLDLRA